MSNRIRAVERGVVALALLLACAVVAGRATVPATAERAASARDDSRMAWWRQARFGLFIHWGLYAIPAGEWNGRTDYGEWIRNNAQIPNEVYDRLRLQFNPSRFDPAAWVKLAKRAGMKYIVITSKHHDGFALWDSDAGQFDVMATPFERDILKELADACQREGIHLGFYHSIMDWQHPDYLPRREWEAEARPAGDADFERYVAFMKRQLRELLTGYGPVAVLWFDGQWEPTWTNDRGRDLYTYVRSLQPSIIVNNRVGRAGGDFGLDREGGRIGDYSTPEQQVPATGIPGVAWESCITMNLNWGYNRADKAFKSPAELVHLLADVASKGGNLLLNVGPTAEGEFPEESVDRLEAIGAWMAVNGESIHGTTASPFPSLPWGRATQKPGAGGLTRLYLHVFDWPTDGRLVVPGLLSDPRSARLLADPSQTPLTLAREGDAVVVGVPAGAPDPLDSVVVLEVSGRPDVAVAPVIEAETEIFVGATSVRVWSDRRDIELRCTIDGSEPTRRSPRVTNPLRLAGTATVKAAAFRADRMVSPVASATFTRVDPRPPLPAAGWQPGLDFEYLEDDITRLPDFDSAQGLRRGTVERFDLSPRSRPTGFAFRFRGVVEVPRTGVYRFSVLSDDGSRLWIGDELVVDNDGLHGPREVSGLVALSAGRHPIAVAMFQATGGAELGVSYSGPGLPKQPIPAAALARPLH